MSIGDLTGIFALIASVLGGIIVALWRRIETISARTHRHASEIQIIINTLHNHKINVPPRRNGNGGS